jgi:hypothetical protein
LLWTKNESLRERVTSQLRCDRKKLWTRNDSLRFVRRSQQSCEQENETSRCANEQLFFFFFVRYANDSLRERLATRTTRYANEQLFFFVRYANDSPFAAELRTCERLAAKLFALRRSEHANEGAAKEAKRSAEIPRVAIGKRDEKKI